MKLLILSDSHGHFDILHKIYKKEEPDFIFFAGDHSKDGEELSYISNVNGFYIVKGNTDRYDKTNPDNLEIGISDYKIFLTHGHLYGVKRGYSKLFNTAKRGYNIVIFGHTHKQTYLKKDEIHFFNPGAAIDGKYGIINIDGNKLDFKHYKI